MSPAQAQAFARHWRVIEQYNGEFISSYTDEFGNPQQATIVTGLSVTIFERVADNRRHVAVRGTAGLADLLTDAIDVALLGTPEMQLQYAALKAKIGEWLLSGTVVPGFTVSGHSLGGFLAGALFVDFPEQIGGAYLYNTPGVGGVRELLALSSEPSLDLSRVTNVRAEGGGSMISGLGIAWGPPKPVVIEVSLNPFENHSIRPLTDSLALYDAFTRLSPTLTHEGISELLRRASVQDSLTFDSTLDALRLTVLGPGAVTAPTTQNQREAFYQSLYALLDSPAYRTLAGNTSLRVLAGTDAATLTTQAKSDFGHFLAVHYLLPFALEGTSSVLIEAHSDLYARWSADCLKRIDGRSGLEFSDAYLADRGQMLAFLMQGNSIDSTSVASNQFSDQVVYRDLGSLRAGSSGVVGPTEVNVHPTGAISLPNGLHTRVFGFGTDAADTIKGRENTDRLYGGRGSDTLIGAGGNDHLEGGAGADQLHGGRGFDTYLADWGDSITDTVEATPGGVIYAGPNQILLTGGTRKEGERWFTGADGFVYWEREDGAVSVFGPDGAAPLLIAPPGTQVPGRGIVDGNLVSGRPDLGIRLVTERAEGLGSVAGSGSRSTVLALWDLARTWRPFADPLALDLDGDGFETIGNVSGEMVLFDHAGGGVRTGTGWLTGGDAWLALDRDGDGLILSGAELFGVDTPLPGGGKGADGFAALRPMDTNGDGVVDAADAPLDAWQVPQDVDADGLLMPGESGGASFANLLLWRDENLNGFSEPYELVSLAQAGIARIRLDATADGRVLGGGNRLLLAADFERGDGTTGRAGALDLVRETFLRDFLRAPSAAPTGDALPNVAGAGEVRDLQEAAAESPALAAAVRIAATAPTREAQLAAIPAAVDLWAGTSGMATGAQAAFARPDEMVLYYQFSDLSPILPWASQSGSFQLPDQLDAGWFASHQSAEYLDRQRKIEALERFTGQTYADVARQTASTLHAADGRLLRIAPVWIGAENWAYLEQAYDALVETAYQGIAIQTRLEPYVAAALRGQAAGGYAEVEALFEARRAADPRAAIGDLVDLARAAGVELVERGWVGLPVMLEAWLREARDDPSLAPALAELGVAFRDNYAIRGSGAGDVLLGSGWMPPFPGGVRLTEGGFGNDLVFGGEVAETTLSDGPGRDLVMGGAEANVLLGGPGRDIFLFGRGSGRDTLQPANLAQFTLALDRDVLQFLPGVAPEDVTVRRVGDAHSGLGAVAFRINGTDDVFIDRWFAYADVTEAGYRSLEGARFADGTFWNAAMIQQKLLEGSDASEPASTVVPGLRGFEDRDDVISGHGGGDGLIGLGGNDILLGGEGNDTLEGGAGNDVLDGGPGDDRLYGGFGVDTYVLDRGGGTDWIIRGNYITWAGTDNDPVLDVVRVADGITQDEVLLQRQAGRLRILLADGSAELLDGGNPLNPHYQAGDGHAPSIGRIEFADGSFWDAQAIRERSLLGATGGPDTIVGFHGANDTLRGLAGDDTLVGLGGDDVLEGGTGVDRLEGGSGADTYVWRRGDGSDDIFDDASDGLASTLRLPDVSLQDLYWDADDRELRIGEESLRLRNPAHLWQVSGADGATVALSAIPAPPVAGPPTDPGSGSGVGSGEESGAPGPGTGSGTGPDPGAGASPGSSGPPSGLPPGFGLPPPPPRLDTVVQGVPAATPVVAVQEDVPVIGVSAETGDSYVDASRLGTGTTDVGAPNQIQVRASEDRVGVPLDPLYREMTARFDILLQVGRANLSERYAEAVREFEERRRQREAPAEPPPPTDEEIMAHNRAMHAWHDRHPGFADVDGVEHDGVWPPGWAMGGGERSFDELLNVGGSPSLANPTALPRLGGAARSPGLAEGIRDLR